MTQAATVDEFGFCSAGSTSRPYVLIVASIWSIHFFFGTGSARFAWALTGFMRSCSRSISRPASASTISASTRCGQSRYGAA
jgi:hypothetical protein